MASKEENTNSNGGRPPFFTTSEELETKINEYFVHIKGEYHYETKTSLNKKTNEEREIEVIVWDREQEPPTITGLALFLGFCSRQSFYYYETKSEFCYAIKKARMKIESEYEKNLYNDKPIGSIFALKNMGWKDKQEVEETKTKKYIIIDGTDDEEVEDE